MRPRRLLEGSVQTRAISDPLQITNIDYFSLVALGFGPYLQMFDSKTGTTGAQNIRNWLLSPNDDYLDYKQTADQLNEAVMTSLLQKACRRFLK